MRSLRRLHEVAMALVVVVSVIGCAQAKPVASVRMASQAEVTATHSRVGTSVLPHEASAVRFDDQQSIHVGGSPELVVLPVSFKSPMQDPVIEGQTLSLCGVIVSSPAASPKLLVTLGTGNTEMMNCTGLKAIGGAPAAMHGTRPNLILIYNAYTGHESFPVTIVLTWDANAENYAVNDSLSQWLGEQKAGRTVAGARRLLATKHDGKLEHP